MTRQVTVTYSRQIIRKAVAHFWMRFIGWHGFAVIALTICAFIILFASGDRTWLVGAAAELSALLVLTSAFLYIRLLRRSFQRFNRMSSKSVAFTFTDDRISWASDIGTSDFAWRAIVKIWKFPDVWLLFVDKMTWVTFPSAGVDQTTLEFITERVVQCGGCVR
jgi:YcxB-like protein